MLYCYTFIFYTGRGCSIDLNGDLPSRNEPIFLKKESNAYTLAVPTVKQKHGVVELDRGENLVLACPGKGNYILETKHQTDSASCVRDTKFMTNDSKRELEISQAGCALPVEAVIKDTRKSCASIGHLFEIGFEVCISGYFENERV